MSIETGNAFVKLVERIESGLHDPFDVQAGLEQGQHPLPGAVHAPADDPLHRHSFEDDVAGVVIDGDGVAGGEAEQREEAAHAHDVERQVDRGRRAGHLEHDIDAVTVGHRIDGGLHFFRARRPDVEGVQVREVVAGGPAAGGLQGVITDVGHDDGARAAVLRDCRGHGADGAKAGDGDRLAGQVTDRRGVDGVAECIEERADAQRNVGAELYHVCRRHFHEFGERAILVQSVDSRAIADVAVAAAAARAFTADDVHLGGDVVADLEMSFVRALRARAKLFDEAAELVAVDARRRDFVADRRIPVIDVFVGAADGRGGDADQHLIGAGFGNWAIADGCALGTIDGGRFDDGEHGVLRMQNSRKT